MKKTCKRFLTALLSAACVMAMTTVAFAASGIDTIDTSQKCSLTIHKFDFTAAMEDGIDVTTMATTYTDGKQHKAEVEDKMKDYVIKDVEFSYVKVGSINTVRSPLCMTLRTHP